MREMQKTESGYRLENNNDVSPEEEAKYEKGGELRSAWLSQELKLVRKEIGGLMEQEKAATDRVHELTTKRDIEKTALASEESAFLNSYTKKNGELFNQMHELFNEREEIEKELKGLEELEKEEQAKVA